MATTSSGPRFRFDAPRREQSIREKTRGSLGRFERAKRTLAGGVSSGIRLGAKPYPLYFTEGAGPRVTDVDGNVYLDYGLAWGPLILGHAPPVVTEALARQLRRGLTFGAQHDLEIEVSEMLTSLVPCGDAVCYANSGTEIVQVALRLARAATGRSKFVKFEGHYHGWADSVLVSYHPSASELAARFGEPIGVGKGQLPPDSTLIAQWNDLASVERCFERAGGEISAVICEPILCNSGCIPPEPGFLDALRDLTRRRGALLIFDEVITGFRVDLRGAQGLYGVTPDLALYAKAIGAGMPLSCLAGKREYMDLIARGEVVHAGSLNGNPMSLAAARAALEFLSRDDGAVYDSMRARGERLRTGLESILHENGHAVVTSGCGPVFQLSFMEKPARNYRGTLAADRDLYDGFALGLLDEGILALPDGRWYISTAHTDADIDQTLAAARRTAGTS